MLTNVVMHAHPGPRRVVVIGGGDGGTVREVLKHDTVEKLYFIEIDRQVIEVSKEFFPAVACSVDDSRVEIKNMDGAEFIRGERDIDIVIVDSTDPIGFARTLYAEEFFTTVRNSLAEEGMYVTHSESLLLHSDIVGQVQNSLKEAFPVAELYATPIATYPGNWWTFSVGSMKLDPREIKREIKIETKFYSDEMHVHSFIPKGFYERVLRGELNW
jgi:spermidine synthase